MSNLNVVRTCWGERVKVQSKESGCEGEGRR